MTKADNARVVDLSESCQGLLMCHQSASHLVILVTQSIDLFPVARHIGLQDLVTLSSKVQL